MSEIKFQRSNFNGKVWLLIVIIFAIIYSLGSLVDHYLFRTYGHDLGMESNAAYDYAHFRLNNCTLMLPEYTNYLSDHLSIELMFISPVIYLFSTYGLLVAQIAFVLLGGAGIYKYVLSRSDDLFLANMSLIFFYSFWGIYSALAFDFHDNVVGAMAVPWIFYFVNIRKIKYAVIAFIWLLISKENMGLWVFFLLTGMAFNFRNDRKTRNLLLYGALFGLIYFYTSVTFIIPSLANAGRTYRYINYSALGNNFSEIIMKLLKAPHLFFDLMYKSTSPDPTAEKVKSELLMFLFLSGGFALIYKPVYLWMIIPLLAQKLFNDSTIRWGVGYHYNIEFATILPIAVYEFINSYIKKAHYRRVTFVLAVFTGIISTFSVFANNHSPNYPYQKIQFYKKVHYQTTFDVRELYRAIKLIPQNAKLCATEQLCAHLALRDYIYSFPEVMDAEYVAILLDGTYYPLNKEEMELKISDFKSDGEWELLYEKNFTLIFKKRL